MLSFLSKVPFTRLGLLAHLKQIYGINSEIRDLRLSNVSAVLSTYIHNPRNYHHLRSSLQRFSDAYYQPGAHARPLGRPAARLDHPTCAWQCARSYFDVVVGQCPNELYERELPSPFRRRHLDLVLPSIQSTLYKGKPCKLMRTRHGLRICNKGWRTRAGTQGRLPVASGGLCAG